MKCIIIYNTRSGNTELLGNEMCKILKKYNHECVIFRDKNVQEDILNQENYFKSYELLCLGSPVHFLGPAFRQFRKLIKKIAPLDLKDKKFIFFGTYGKPKSWKTTITKIQKRMVNINYYGNVGCIKRKNEEALQNFEQIIKNIR